MELEYFARILISQEQKKNKRERIEMNERTEVKPSYPASRGKPESTFIKTLD